MKKLVCALLLLAGAMVLSAKGRTWVFDAADSVTRLGTSFKQEKEGHFSAELNFASQVAFALPAAGDTVEFHVKAVSDVDLPYLTASVIDRSEAANWWKDLYTGDDAISVVATDIKAGEPFEFTKTYVLDESPVGGLSLWLQYDNQWEPYSTDYPVVGKAAMVTFTRTVQSTDSFVLSKSKATKYVLDATDSGTNGTRYRFAKADWGNLAADPNLIDKDFSWIFAGNLPQKGDYVDFYLRGVSDTDIPWLSVGLADTSREANGWMELADWSGIQEIKAGVPFETRILFKITETPKDSIVLRFQYDAPKKAASITTERVTQSTDVTKLKTKAKGKVYNIDLSDADDGSKVLISYDDSQWARQYHAQVSYRDLVKGDWPKAGDTIIFHYNFVSDTNIPFVYADIVDNTKAANWYLKLTESGLELKDIKAGEPVTGHIVRRLEKSPVGGFALSMIYDAEWQAAQYGKVGKSATLTFTPIAESTKTVKPRPPKTYNIDLAKAAKTITLDGGNAQGMPETDPAKITMYGNGGIDLTKLFGKDLPRKGDTVNVLYKGTLSLNLTDIIGSLVESNDVHNWRELTGDSEEKKFVTGATDIKAGEPFTMNMKFTLIRDADYSIKLQLFASPAKD